MGFNGWCAIEVSDSSRSPRTGAPGRRCGRAPGEAGQMRVMRAPAASSRASATGPMLPASVESNVEQYLKYTRSVPRPVSHRCTRRDWATASPGSIVRLFSATTTASHAGTVRSRSGRRTAAPCAAPRGGEPRRHRSPRCSRRRCSRSQGRPPGASGLVMTPPWCRVAWCPGRVVSGRVVSGRVVSGRSSSSGRVVSVKCSASAARCSGRGQARTPRRPPRPRPGTGRTARARSRPRSARRPGRRP